MSSVRRHKPLPLDIQLNVIAVPLGEGSYAKLRMVFEFVFPFKDNVGRVIGYVASYQKSPVIGIEAFVYTYATRDGLKYSATHSSAHPLDQCEAEIYKKACKSYWRYHRLYSPRALVL